MELIKNPRGAGRKPTIAKDGGKRINVYLDAESISIAKNLGIGNVSAGIRAACEIAQTPQTGKIK